MENQADTIIGAEVKIKGNLKNKGSILVNGMVEGEIRSDENVTIGEGAKVTGPIIAKEVLVSGAVAGTVEASGKLEMDPTGTISGDIKTKTLIVREGATFNGKSSMTESEESTATPDKNSDKGNKVEQPKNKEEETDKKPSAPAKEGSKSSFWDKTKNKK